MKTALVFGSSGLVGGHLVNQLILNSNYSKIKIFVRSKIELINPKIEIIDTNFNDLEKYRNDIKGEDCFFCIGTCLLYTSPSPRDRQKSRMPSSA